MNAKHVANIAKNYIIEIYSDEKVANVGLEEIDYNDSEGIWYVTIGFSRPWDEPNNILAAMATQGAKRSFKILRISDGTGDVLSIKNRDLIK
jgi:hypothetical protein